MPGGLEAEEPAVNHDGELPNVVMVSYLMYNYPVMLMYNYLVMLSYLSYNYLVMVSYLMT